jgi:hypothetical protein
MLPSKTAVAAAIVSVTMAGSALVAGAAVTGTSFFSADKPTSVALVSDGTTTTTVADATTTTGSPAPTTTTASATTAEPVMATAPTTAEAITSPQPDIGAQVFSATGGSITAALVNGKIVVSNTVATDGFTAGALLTDHDGTEVEVKFSSATTVSKLEVELEDGVLVAKTEDRAITDSHDGEKRPEVEDDGHARDHDSSDDSDSDDASKAGATDTRSGERGHGDEDSGSRHSGDDD